MRDASGSFGGTPVSVKPSPSVGALYGTGLALNAAGTTLAIGAPTETVGQGAVYVCTDPAGTGFWGLNQKLSANALGFSINSNFGSRVALNSAGDTLAIGAPNHSADKGGFIVFVLVVSWTAQSSILLPPSISGSPQVGMSLALNAAGDMIAVGGTLDIAQGANAGAVFTYKRDAGGVWSYVQKLLPSDSVNSFSREFGIAVALSANGNTLIIGAEEEAGTGAWW